jgi:hypothetical protein
MNSRLLNIGIGKVFKSSSRETDLLQKKFGKEAIINKSKQVIGSALLGSAAVYLINSAYPFLGSSIIQSNFPYFFTSLEFFGASIITNYFPALISSPKTRAEYIEKFGKKK